MAGGTRRKPSTSDPNGYWEPPAAANPPPKEGAKVRCWPVDDFDAIHEAAGDAKGFDFEGTYRWLKVPLLGQHAGAASSFDWCGRTSASMVYNYHALLRSRESEYITHWVGPVGWGGYRDLRHHDGPRAFHNRAFDRSPGRANGAVVGWYLSNLAADLDGKLIPSGYLNTGMGPKYATAQLFERMESEARGAERLKTAARIAANPDELNQKFDPVIQSIDKNNPVVIATGISEISIHFVLITGYKWIPDEGASQPALWLRICNPANFDPTYFQAKGVQARPGVPPAPEINYQSVFTGNWNTGLGSISWVRARKFFEPNSHSKDKKYDLMMDYQGNGGGAVDVCVGEASPPDLAVSSSSSAFFPLTGFVRPQQYFRNAESSDGGFYGLDVTRTLHGGVHLRPTEDERGKPFIAKAIAPGYVVAARLGVPIESTASRSANFVLLRHEMILGDSAEADAAQVSLPPLVFYSLYMHLVPYRPDQRDGLDWLRIPWLRRFHHRGSEGCISHLPSKGISAGERLAKVAGNDMIDGNGEVHPKPRQTVPIEPEAVDQDAFVALLDNKTVTFRHAAYPVRQGEPVAVAAVKKARRFRGVSTAPGPELHFEIFLSVEAKAALIEPFNAAPWKHLDEDVESPLSRQKTLETLLGGDTLPEPMRNAIDAAATDGVVTPDEVLALYKRPSSEADKVELQLVHYNRADPEVAKGSGGTPWRNGTVIVNGKDRGSAGTVEVELSENARDLRVTVSKDYVLLPAAAQTAESAEWLRAGALLMRAVGMTRLSEWTAKWWQKLLDEDQQPPAAKQRQALEKRYGDLPWWATDEAKWHGDSIFGWEGLPADGIVENAHPIFFLWALSLLSSIQKVKPAEPRQVPDAAYPEPTLTALDFCVAKEAVACGTEVTFVAAVSGRPVAGLAVEIELTAAYSSAEIKFKLPPVAVREGVARTTLHCDHWGKVTARATLSTGGTALEAAAGLGIQKSIDVSPPVHPDAEPWINEKPVAAGKSIEIPVVNGTSLPIHLANKDILGLQTDVVVHLDARPEEGNEESWKRLASGIVHARRKNWEFVKSGIPWAFDGVRTRKDLEDAGIAKGPLRLVVCFYSGGVPLDDEHKMASAGTCKLLPGPGDVVAGEQILPAGARRPKLALFVPRVLLRPMLPGVTKVSLCEKTKTTLLEENTILTVGERYDLRIEAFNVGGIPAKATTGGGKFAEPEALNDPSGAPATVLPKNGAKVGDAFPCTFVLPLSPKWPAAEIGPVADGVLLGVSLGSAGVAEGLLTWAGTTLDKPLTFKVARPGGSVAIVVPPDARTGTPEAPIVGREQEVQIVFVADPGQPPPKKVSMRLMADGIAEPIALVTADRGKDGHAVGKAKLSVPAGGAAATNVRAIAQVEEWSGLEFTSGQITVVEPKIVDVVLTRSPDGKKATVTASTQGFGKDKLRIALDRKDKEGRWQPLFAKFVPPDASGQATLVVDTAGVAGRSIIAHTRPNQDAGQKPKVRGIEVEPKDSAEAPPPSPGAAPTAPTPRR